MRFSLRLVVLTLVLCLVVSLVGNAYLAIQYHYSSRHLDEDHAVRYPAIVKNNTYMYHEHMPRSLNQSRFSLNNTIKDNFIHASSINSTINERHSSNLSLSPNEFKYFRKIFSIDSSKSLETEQFTILTMTYKRPSLLKILIPHYCSTGPRLHKILIIWNDIDTDIPQELKQITCEVQLHFIVSKENKLTNRFIPYQEIETQAVFCIDDDRKITHEDLIFAFQSWQQLRYKVLGFERRTHTVMQDGSYVYGEKDDVLQTLGYSIVLSTNFILHKSYFEMFQSKEFLPPGIIKYVDEKMNCEDFAMCLMVGDYLERISSTQSCCLVVKGKYYPANLEEKNDPDGYQGLSKRGGRHYSERTKCLNDFRLFYKDGRLPLYYTQIKVSHESKLYYSKRKKIHWKE